MFKIYKEVKPVERYLNMSEHGQGIDIGVVDGNGKGLGCLVHVHNDNRVELIRDNSTDNSGMILSKYGTIIPTTDISLSKIVTRDEDRVKINCLGNADVSLDFAEALAFSLLNLCYEMRKDAKS